MASQVNFNKHSKKKYHLSSKLFQKPQRRKGSHFLNVRAGWSASGGSLTHREPCLPSAGGHAVRLPSSCSAALPVPLQFPCVASLCFILDLSPSGEALVCLPPGTENRDCLENCLAGTHSNTCPSTGPRAASAPESDWHWHLSLRVRRPLHLCAEVPCAHLGVLSFKAILGTPGLPHGPVTLWYR